MKCDMRTLMYVEKGRKAGMWDTPHSSFPLIMIWRAARKPKNSSPFKSHQLWGMFLLRTLLNVIIGGPNELWPRSPICLPQLPYWFYADAYQNDECSIKFKWVGRLRKGEKSCLTLHDLVLFSASHCTKTACYFNHVFLSAIV